MKTPKTVLETLVKQHGSMRKAAKAKGISQAMCSYIMSGRKQAGAVTLKKLGLRVVYK